MQRDVCNLLQAAIGNIEDLRMVLPVHKTLRYHERSLDDITTLVVHHSDTRSNVSWRAVARYHVEHNGWPGIGYHFGVTPAGKVSYLNDIATHSYHARQANAIGVGICCMGNYTAQQPSGAMVEALAVLMNCLDAALGKPLFRVGHRDVVDTTCPGDALYAVIPKAHETLPQDEPDAPVGVLASKVRWWLEEYRRSVEQGSAQRATEILDGLTNRDYGLLYRLERAASDVA